VIEEGAGDREIQTNKQVQTRNCGEECAFMLAVLTKISFVCFFFRRSKTETLQL